MSDERGSAAISPTAHYTGYVWARNGLSHPLLRTPEGHLFYEALRPANAVASVVLGASLERYLLARHTALDDALERAIEDDGVSQVIELAAGLSARGWRFGERSGAAITYVETDLPGMAERKRRALGEIGVLSEHHRVEELDALRDAGPDSLAAIAGELDPDRGLAIVTEGLLPYLDAGTVARLWARVAGVLGDFTTGRYISDLHLANLHAGYVRLFRLGLSGFVRGRVAFHFPVAEKAEAELHAAGFDAVAVTRAPGFAIGGGHGVHIIEASTNP